MVRSVPDGANLIDTPIAAFLFQGMGRQAIDSTLAAGSSIPPECEPVAAVGIDGMPNVFPEPPVSEIRACVRALFNVGFDSSSGSFGPAPVEVEVDVPASTAPEADPGG